MVDRNTAFYFLDKNETGRSEWFITSIIQWNIAWLTWVNDSDDVILDRKFELLTCEESLKELVDFVAVAKDTAKEQLIPAELQVVNSFLWIFHIFHHATFCSSCQTFIPMQLTVFKLFISCRQRICPVKWKGYSSLAHKWPNLFYLPYWEYLPSY